MTIWAISFMLQRLAGLVLSPGLLIDFASSDHQQEGKASPGANPKRRVTFSFAQSHDRRARHDDMQRMHF
jgi:hypothetical protein